MRFRVSLLALAVYLPASWICASPVSAELVNRRVAALYNSQEEKTTRETRIHRHLEVVLNHYGLIVDYYDVSAGLPDDKTMSAYRGIVTWFRGESMPRAKAYAEWLSRRMREGTKVLILENLGFLADADTRIGRTPDETVNAVLSGLGLRHGFEWSSQSYEVEIESADTRMAAFERPLVFDYRPFEHIVSIHPAGRVYLKLRRKNPLGGEQLADAIVVTPNGGFAMQDYVFYEDHESGKRMWRLNPFLFVKESLGLTPVVAPDVTTRCGRRVFYSHIDGDGFNNRVYHGLREPASKIIHDEILKKYNLPISVSVITADIMPEFLGSDDNIRLCREIFRRPNVEAATHTFTHPLVWEKLDAAGGAHGREIQTAFGRKYVAQSSYILRAVQNVRRDYRMNSRDEILGSLDFINSRLAPPDRPARMVFWSGDCLPDESTLDLVRANGLLNINGGDSRFDSFYPSRMYLFPLRRQVGRPGTSYQIYATNQNENPYTNLWAGPYHAYRHVLSTFMRTETPARIRPINVYYHFYSAERPASLQALKTVYDWALAQEIHPLFTSEFIESVQGFFSAEIHQNGPNDYSVKNTGSCRTIRFEDLPDGFAPDLDRSRGVLGFRETAGVLYVHLDESSEHRIVFGRGVNPARPYLVESSAGVRAWTAADRRVAFQADIKGVGVFRIGNAVPGTYRVTVTDDRGGSRVFRLETRGREIVFRDDRFGRVNVEIVRHEG